MIDPVWFRVSWIHTRAGYQQSDWPTEHRANAFARAIKHRAGVDRVQVYALSQYQPAA